MQWPAGIFDAWHAPFVSAAPGAGQFHDCEELDEPYDTTAARLNFRSDWTYAPAPETAKVDIKPRYDLFIDGRFVAPAKGEYFDTINPAARKESARVAQATGDDVDRAVKAARRAYEKVWSRMPAKERGKYIYRIARMLQERRARVRDHRVDGRREGRSASRAMLMWPLECSRTSSITRGGPGQARLRFPGKSERSRSASRGQIIPWNFPLLDGRVENRAGAGDGNTVVLKPPRPRR
jgi:aldehyde dehydrogenase (NAD+)